MSLVYFFGTQCIKFVMSVCVFHIGWADQEQTWRTDSTWSRECFSQIEGVWMPPPVSLSWRRH